MLTLTGVPVTNFAFNKTATILVKRRHGYVIDIVHSLNLEQEPYGYLSSASAFIDKFSMASVGKINGK